MMLINGGGHRRTTAEHGTLLERAGLALDEVTPLGPGFSVLVARPSRASTAE